MPAKRFYRRGNQQAECQISQGASPARTGQNASECGEMRMPLLCAANLHGKKGRAARSLFPGQQNMFDRFAQWKWKRQGCRPETRLGTLSPNPFFASRIKNSRAVSRCPAASFILPSRGYFPVRTFQTPCSGYPASASSPPPAPRECSYRSQPRCPQSPRGTGRDSPPPP